MHLVSSLCAGDGGLGWWSKCGCLGLSFQLLAAPILRPVRRTRQARVVVVFQGHSLGSGGGWGFRAGLTEPLSGHERCVEELAATEPVSPGVGVWCARNSCGVIYFTACKLYTYEACHNAP